MAYLRSFRKTYLCSTVCGSSCKEIKHSNFNKWSDHYICNFCGVLSLDRSSRCASRAFWRGPHSQALCSVSGGRTHHVSWDQHLSSTASPTEHIQLLGHQCPVSWGDQVGFNNHMFRILEIKWRIGYWKTNIDQPLILILWGHVPLNVYDGYDPDCGCKLLL